MRTSSNNIVLMVIVVMAILLFMLGGDRMLLPQLPPDITDNGPWLLLIVGVLVFAMRDRRRRASFPESSS